MKKLIYFEQCPAQNVQTLFTSNITRFFNSFDFCNDYFFSMLEMMINPNSGIRLQDANTWFTNIVTYPLGYEIALSFLANRWDDIYD